MTAPVPEYGPGNSPVLSNADAAAIQGAKLDVPAMLSALKAAPVGSTGGPTMADLNGSGPSNPGSALQNIVDFIETPFYMLTNTIDNSLTRQDKGGAPFDINDLTKGVQQGIDAGINHNPAYAKDFIDIAQHNIKGTNLEGTQVGKDMTNIAGIGGDMILDPINLIPGTGVGKTVLKAPGIAMAALKDAGKAGAAKVAEGAAKVAESVPEPLGAEALGGADGAAKPADWQVGTDGVTTPAEPPAAPTAPLDHESAKQAAVDDYHKIPEIANILKAQEQGPTQAVLSALGNEMKTNWATSDASKMLNGIKNFISPAEKKAFLQPLTVDPEALLQAHLEGVANKDALAKEPVATMAAPDTVKAPTVVEDPPKAPKETVAKQADIVNSAAANTLANKSWEAMSPEDRQATRMAEADKRTASLNEPIVLHPEVVNKEKAAAAGKLNDRGASTPLNLQPGFQQKTVTDMVNQTKHYQAGAEFPEINEEGYRGPEARTKGASAQEAGGIRHPLLMDSHSQQLPFKNALQAIHGKPVETVANGVVKKSIEGGMDPLLAKSGRRVSRFDKLGIVTKLLKAHDSQLQAVGMIPVLNMSKAANEGGYIHLTKGDILEAISAKSVDGIHGKSTLTKGDLMRHIIGSDKKDMVNPLAFDTAMETLLHERKGIMEAIKKAGGSISPERVEQLLDQSQSKIKDVLMGEGSAYGKKATKDDLKNIGATRDEAITARQKAGKGGAKEYEKDMDELAHKIIRDPHIGTMLEQRHLYNQAMHKADLEKFTESNWADLKNRLARYSSGPWSYEKTLNWLNTVTKDTTALLPEVDRNQYTDWVKQLKGEVLTPAEEKAAKAADPKTTIGDSRKDAENALKASGDQYGPIDVYAGQIATDVMRSLHPIQSFFNAKFPYLATGNFYDTVMQGKHSLMRVQSMMHQSLTDYLMKYNKDGQLLEDTKAIITAANGKMAVEGDSARELKKNLGVLFNTDSRYIKAIKAGTLDKDFLKEVLNTPKYAGVFDAIDSRWYASATKDNLHEFWQHMNITSAEQAADIISKMHSAVMDLNSRVAMARSFEKEFGSVEPKEGHSKITWNIGRKRTNGMARIGAIPRAASEGPGFYDLLDKSLYYDKAAAWEVPAVHRLINESRKVSDKTFVGRFVNNVFDPVTQVMKATQTTLRPGHWVSNVMGDTVRNFLAGVTDPRSYAYNMRVLSAIGRDEQMFAKGLGSKFERATTLAAGQYGKNIPKSELKHMVPIRINGNVKYYTATEIGRMMDDKIFIAPHGAGQHEDYLSEFDQGAGGKFANATLKATDAILDNKLFNFNKYSALRDNLTRGALAMDTLIHGDHASIEDAFNKAFVRVRKWAPTSADFSREESVYARRAILYYTWLRGMIPNIIEGMVEKPGVYMAPNKLLYAQAKANGVEPMSVGKPFPINQLFPQYYYENIIGPQMKTEDGQLWGYSPMAPSIDVMQTLMNPNPGANLLGMASPFAKIPIEMATGQSNGIPIKDNAQYLQDNVLPPQLDMISKGTGKELYNPTQNRTDKGNSMPVPGTGIPADVFNFFTGLHATDYNSPADLRSSIAEAKTAKSALRSDIQRNNR
jgi:hypothetical protein